MPVPTADEKARIIDAAVRVGKASLAYQQAIAHNDAVEKEVAIWTWPVADLLECIAESRKRVELPALDEDQTLETLERMGFTDIRQRYAEERKQRDENLEKLYGAVAASEHEAGD